jgi:hypothetical protein
VTLPRSIAPALEPVKRRGKCRDALKRMAAASGQTRYQLGPKTGRNVRCVGLAESSPGNALPGLAQAIQEVCSAGTGAFSGWSSNW